jgi:hypothetical protein
MTIQEEKKWAYLTKKYPELAGVAYELYLRHDKKNANPTTYFMWAGKLERQTEKRYREGLKKYCEKQKTKMELKND